MAGKIIENRNLLIGWSLAIEGYYAKVQMLKWARYDFGFCIVH